MSEKIIKESKNSTPGQKKDSYIDPVLSLTILFKALTRAKMTKPPKIAATAMLPKKTLLSGILSQKLAITPANFPPREIDRNQPPIIKAVSR